MADIMCASSIQYSDLGENQRLTDISYYHTTPTGQYEYWEALTLIF